MAAPEDWTDDLTVRVAPWRTLDELVDYVLSAKNDGNSSIAILEALNLRFGLSFDDARLAVDRARTGRNRAEYGWQAPDPIKDPVAYLAYQKSLRQPGWKQLMNKLARWMRTSRGAPPFASTQPSRARLELIRVVSESGPTAACGHMDSHAFQREATSNEREAAALWRQAIEAAGSTSPGSSRQTTTVAVAVRLGALATHTVESRATAAMRSNVLLQLGVSLQGAINAAVDRRPESRYVEAGTDAWFGAIALEETSLELRRLFACIGDETGELKALGLRGRVVTSLLGHCYERVAKAMLDSAECALRLGDREQALGICESLTGDLAGLVVEWWERRKDGPFDEHCLALQRLIAAIDLRASIEGQLDSELQSLRTRCTALLNRSPHPQ